MRVHYPIETGLGHVAACDRLTEWQKLDAKAKELIALIMSCQHFDAVESVTMASRISEAMSDNKADMDITETEEAVINYEDAA